MVWQSNYHNICEATFCPFTINEMIIFKGTYAIGERKNEKCIFKYQVALVVKNE
jgi:hypothetical protein